jgi:aminoglycoside phosphotransferase (APT) family kinase protein
LALEALSFARERRWPLSAMPGDLSASNLIVTPAGQIAVIDWEHFSPAFLPAVDLARFAFDVMGDGALLPTKQRNALRDHVSQTLRSLLKDQGIQKADCTKLHALFLVHQMVSVGIPSRNAALASRYALDGGNSPL